VSYDRDPRADALVKRFKAGQRDLGLYHNHCEDLARVFSPGRLGFTSQRQEGDRRSDDIYDGTGMQAARALANAIDDMLWPDGEQSFFLETLDDDIRDDDEVREWLQDSADRLDDAFDNPKARFRQARGEANSDIVVFGGAHMFMGEGQDLGYLLFQTLHPRDVVTFYDDEGNENGKMRSRRFTLRQAAQRFGEQNLSRVLREKLEESKADTTKLDQSYDFLHAVVQRKEAPKGALLKKNLPWADFWIEMDACHIVEEGGYHEYPFAGPRWETSSGENTGRSPGMIALPDTNTLQAQEETLLIAGQRAAAPPLLVPNDGAFDAANTAPDGITYYDAALATQMRRIPIAPLESGANIPIVMEMQDKKREQVWTAFLRHVLNLPIDGPQMTAEEVRARLRQMMRELGPVFGRFETDYKAPTVERPFMVMLRAGGFKPIPQRLLGRGIKFRYSSPVKKLKKLMEVAAAKAFARERAEIAKLIGSPEPMDIIDFDALGQFEARATDIPDIVIRSPEQIAEIRGQRQQAAQAQAEAQMAQMAADAAQKGSQAVKNLQPQEAAA